MADRYWIAGTGSWTVAANWASTSGGGGGAGAPGNGDIAYFDANSGSGTVTISATAAAHSIDCVNGTGGVSSAITLVCSGARTLTLGGVATTGACVITLGGGFTWTGGGTFTISVDNRAGGMTVTTGGKTMSGITTFQTLTNASQTTITFADNCNMGAANITLQRGGMTVASAKTLTTTGTWAFTGTTGAETLTYTGATLSCGTVSITGAGTLTLTGNSSSQLTCTGAGITFTGGGKTFPGTVTLNGGGTSTLAGANTYLNLTLQSTAAFNDTVLLAANQNFQSGSAITFTGNAVNQRLVVRSDTFGTQRSLTNTSAAGRTFTNVDFQDISASTSTSGTSLGDLGGNASITFTTPKIVYWVAGTGNWSDATTHWASSSNGSPGSANYPIVQDTATFDTHSFSGAGQIVTLDEPNISAIDASAATNNTHTFTMSNGGANTFNDFYGNLTFAAQSTLTDNGTTHFRSAFRGTQTLTMNGGTFTTAAASATTVTINNGSGNSFKLGSDLTITNSPSFVSTLGWSNNGGTFDCNGFNFSVGKISTTTSATSSFIMASGKTLTLTATGSLFFLNSATMTIQGSGMNVAITDTSATLKTFYANANGGSGVVWGDLLLNASTGGLQLAASNAVQTKDTTFNSMQIVTDGGPTPINIDIALSAGLWNLTTPVFFPGNPQRIAVVSSDGAQTAQSSNFKLVCSQQIITRYIYLADCDTLNNGGNGLIAYNSLDMSFVVSGGGTGPSNFLNQGCQFFDSPDSPTGGATQVSYASTSNFMNNYRTVITPDGISAGGTRFL